MLSVQKLLQNRSLPHRGHSTNHHLVALPHLSREGQISRRALCRRRSLLAWRAGRARHQAEAKPPKSERQSAEQRVTRRHSSLPGAHQRLVFLGREFPPTLFFTVLGCCRGCRCLPAALTHVPSGSGRLFAGAEGSEPSGAGAVLVGVCVHRKTGVYRASCFCCWPDGIRW